jgi:hypothetical protein
LKVSSSQNFKQLHLQIDDPGSDISLSGLLDIAEACPMLKSLHSPPSHAQAVSKAVNTKPSAFKALKGAAKQVSRVASVGRRRRRQKKLGPKKSTSQASPKAAQRSFVNAVRGTTKRVTSRSAPQKKAGKK